MNVQLWLVQQIKQTAESQFQTTNTKTIGGLTIFDWVRGNTPKNSQLLHSIDTTSNKNYATYLIAFLDKVVLIHQLKKYFALLSSYKLFKFSNIKTIIFKQLQINLKNS